MYLFLKIAKHWDSGYVERQLYIHFNKILYLDDSWQ